MIHIIHISASYKPAYIYGGPIMSVSMLCEALQRHIDEAEIEVLTTAANGEDELQVDLNRKVQVDGVEVTYHSRITKDHTHFSPSLLSSLYKKVKYCIGENAKGGGGKALVIHIHAWWNLVSIFSCQLAKWRGVSVVLSPRGMLTNYTMSSGNTWLKSAIHRFIGKKLLAYCHIHATSEQEKEDILSFVKPKRITVIPNLVRFDDGISATMHSVPSTGQAFKMIFLSRIDEKKGLPFLFDALSLLEIDWTLKIAGNGKEEYVQVLKQKAVDLGIGHRISWLGQVSNENKFDLLARQDLLVLISHNENFANVVIESLSVGTPVLISTSVGLSKYVLKQNMGWTTTTCPAAIAHRISEIAAKENDRSRIKREAPAMIRRDFNERLLVERYFSMYQAALACTS